MGLGGVQLRADESTDTARQWAGEVSGLVSLPGVSLRIFELLQSPDASIGELGEVISHDPNLTARLLKLVNSSLYSLSKRVDTISRAITVIGERELYSLVLAVSAVTTFKGIPNVIVNMDTFWRHSLYCGLIARTLAKKARILHPERLFVAGLLHDVGSLVLFNRAPGIARELVMVSDGDEELLCQAEAEELGFTHADLGGLLLDQWQMPDALRDAVRGHHEPARAGSARREAAIVHIADLLANTSAIGAFFERPAAERRIRVHAWDLAGIVRTDIDPEALIGEAGLQFADTASFLVGGGA